MLVMMMDDDDVGDVGDHMKRASGNQGEIMLLWLPLAFPHRHRRSDHNYGSIWNIPHIQK